MGEQGYYRDPDAGDYVLQWRVYDAVAGRFRSVDPLGFEPDESNLYRYVANNAPNATDPSGLQALPQVLPPVLWNPLDRRRDAGALSPELPPELSAQSGLST